ncbi:MAG TPA: hypothetical protein VD994_07830 [Prosthecobacter sp.]|nr:hypothetical protein [Prosthecobacter sp.]
MKRTILEQFNQIPPRVCRVLARDHRGKALTRKQLAARSGLSEWFILFVSRLEKWDEVSVSSAQAFSRACGVDLLRPRRVLEYIKRGQFTHIRDCRDRAYLLRLMKGDK